MFEDLIRLAESFGFSAAAVVKTETIPIEPGFRICCEENLCGQYGANYTCPPDCGTVEQMRQKLQSGEYALVLQTIHEINDEMDMTQIKPAKNFHNRLSRELKAEAKKLGYSGFLVGSSGCGLCTPCACREGKPCRFPEDAFSCMSAYCVFVRELAEQCDMEYDCGAGLVAFFGMFVVQEKPMEIT